MMHTPGDFEQQLRALQPVGSERGEASLLYACGFAAGRRTALAEKPAPNGSSWRLVAAAMVVAVISGWAGYGLARHDGRQPQVASKPAVPSPKPPLASEEAAIRPAPGAAPTSTSQPQVTAMREAVVAPWFSLPFNPFRNLAERSPQPTSSNGVMLTARSDADEWTRWMQEKPMATPRAGVGSHKRTSTPTDSEPPKTLRWRSGVENWEQWIQ